MLAGNLATRCRLSDAVHVPGRRQQHRAARRASSGIRWATGGRRSTGPTASYYDNLITGVAGITKGINGRDRVRTLVARSRRRSRRGTRRGRRLPEPASAYPSLVISIDPAARDAVRASAVGGRSNASCRGRSRSPPTSSTCAASSSSTLDYNPLVPSLGANRRPLDRQRRRGHIGIGAAIHVVRRDLVSRPHGGGVAAIQRPASAHDQLHAVKGRRQRHGFQSEFIAQDSGRGRDPGDPNRAAGRVRSPDWEKGPSVQDQRHRLVLSGVLHRALRLEMSSIVDRRPRAGRTTFWRASISMATATAARPATAREPLRPILPRRRAQQRDAAHAGSGRCAARRRFALGGRVSVWRGSSRCSTSSIGRTTPT